MAKLPTGCTRFRQFVLSSSDWKDMSRFFLLIFFICLLFASNQLIADVPLDSLIVAKDTTGTITKETKQPPLTPVHWNVIKFNPTPMLLFSDLRNITIAYERMINKTQSVSIQVGYLLFPRLFDDTIARLIRLHGRSKYGVNLSLDYRYYPFSRNRRPAPDGLYIGGYLSYYGFNFKNDFDILHTTVDQNGTLSGKLNVVNLGLSLGYQFIFWKRLTLDLLMFGPSLSRYSGSLNISGNLDPSQIEELDQEMIDALLSKYPMLKYLFSKDGLEFTGSRSSLSIGFRYSIQLGFHF